MLRASYTPSPGRSLSNTPTPYKFKSSTPTPKKTPGSLRKKTPSTKSSIVATSGSTPVAGASSRAEDGDITDNLLNLPRRKPATAEKIDLNTDNLLNISAGSSKRARAQDFFKKS